MSKPASTRNAGPASVPGLAWPPEKPTSVMPSSLGFDRNFCGTLHVGGKAADGGVLVDKEWLSLRPLKPFVYVVNEGIVVYDLYIADVKGLLFGL